MTDESSAVEVSGVQLAKPGRWIGEGLRTAFFMKPDYRGLQATPGLLAGLLALLVLFGIAVQRLAVHGPAVFYWQAVATGWLGPLMTLWVCWIVARQGAAGGEPPQPAGTLFALLLAQSW